MFFTLETAVLFKENQCCPLLLIQDGDLELGSQNSELEPPLITVSQHFLKKYLCNKFHKYPGMIKLKVSDK